MRYSPEGIRPTQDQLDQLRDSHESIETRVNKVDRTDKRSNSDRPAVSIVNRRSSDDE